MKEKLFIFRLLLFIISIPSPFVFIVCFKKYYFEGNRIAMMIAGVALWLCVYSVLFLFTYMQVLY